MSFLDKAELKLNCVISFYFNATLKGEDDTVDVVSYFGNEVIDRYLLALF